MPSSWKVQAFERIFLVSDLKDLKKAKQSNNVEASDQLPFSRLIFLTCISMLSNVAERQFRALLYIVLTTSILIGQEPPAYFENSRDFVGKDDYRKNLVKCNQPRPETEADYTCLYLDCSGYHKNLIHYCLTTTK